MLLPGMAGALLAAGATTGPATSTAMAAPDPRLKTAAHEFEASLMQELLKPLQKDPLFQEGADAESADGSENSLTSFGSEALARAISDRGGFGIAAKILAQFRDGEAGAGGDAGPHEKIPGIGEHLSTKVSPSFADDLKRGEQA